jgi:hypothetical protein
LAGFIYWETQVAKEPILPFDIWKSPSFGMLMICVFFSFMSLGIFFWYMNIYMQTIRGNSLIMVGVQYLPLTIVGCANAFFAAWLVPRVPAQVIIGMGCLAMVVINVLLATIPADLTYWAMAFPAMFISAFTIDLITTSGQIIASNTVPLKHQGVSYQNFIQFTLRDALPGSLLKGSMTFEMNISALIQRSIANSISSQVAGSLIGTLLSYGMSTGLGFAGTVEVNTFEAGKNLLRGYHSAAYLAVGLSVAALVITAVFIRIPKDTREGWGDHAEEHASVS